MRAEQLRVELYPRSPWEAMELGIALVRTHARAIWLPWFVLSLPLVVLINGLCPVSYTHLDVYKRQGKR